MIGEWRRDGYLISTDRSLLDLETIRDFLKISYWAEGVSRENVRLRVKNSLAFGLYLEDEQIGFARAVTDYASFAHLSDVFVLEAYRGNGLGKWLVEVVLSHPDLAHLKWTLATEDAHELYREHGFTELQRTWIHMEKPATKHGS